MKDALQKEKAWLLSDKYNGQKSAAYQNDVALLEQGTPLAYVIGWVPFAGATIWLDSHPLIPRPETEYWTSKLIKEIPIESSPRVLDICAGSGCVGVAIAKAIPGATVTFAELDTAHHETIHRNLQENNITANRYQIRGGDLFQNVPHQYFDYIVSNPPYIDPDNDTAEESVREHEPHLALYGGKHGLDIIANLLEKAKNYMHSSTLLVIEHDPWQQETIQRLTTQLGYIATTKPDQYGESRYSEIKRII